MITIRDEIAADVPAREALLDRCLGERRMTKSSERLREGPAIVQYIADQVPAKNLAPANGTMDRYRLQEWLTFIGTELHKGLFLPLLDKKAPPEAKSYALEKYVSRLDYVEDHLKGRDYLLDHFSVADAYLAAVDVLATLAAYHHRQRSMVTLRHIKQQLVEHRDSDDKQLLGD